MAEGEIRIVFGRLQDPIDVQLRGQGYFLTSYQLEQFAEDARQVQRLLERGVLSQPEADRAYERLRETIRHVAQRARQ